MPAQGPPTADAVSRNAVVILATIACGTILYVLSDILTPLALALFLAVMIDSFARVLEQRAPFVSKRFAMPLAIVLSVFIFGAAAFFIADNATSFATQLVAYAPKLNGLIARLAALAGMDAPPSLTQLVQELNPASYLGQVAQSLQSFVSTAVFVLVYLGFILASRRGWERKAIHLFATRDERQEAVSAFLRIRNGVEQYLWVQTVTGLMIAVASWLAMVAVGLDNALFWAILIFIASYIPFVGGVIAVAAPPIFALLQFDTLWQAIVLFVVLQAVTTFVGNVVLPRMQGRSLNIDPIVLLLALAFWTVVWGLTGAFLSTPLTTVMMVILAQFAGTRWIAVILSEDGDPGELRRETEPAPEEVAKATRASRPARKPPARRRSSS
ncbi:AI-2E family transporter [Phenylobacterium sp. SCN 70-31]|uniref:AI-2E family transporter n=1 Tax=Phenylobacterium sp. SCN 70-31 TaxID=1660129 RepID=UPI00086C423C|nr:AI-2E family transporter [Phenylobacterium sp. SCN 70-31]ODT88986.1 MAG: AI-2E family transporter [Phenylobacterium sp. SCN 70-31]